MVVDPETWKTAAETGLVEGLTVTTITFLPAIINSGKNWISARFKDHPKEAQESAQRNVNNFFGEVNIHIGALEEFDGNIGEKEKRALSDPDYTYLLYEAVLGAARTDSEQKHKLLARLVTDRLTAEPDSLRTLAAHMACNAVPQLSPTHLKLLGAMYIIHYLPAPSYLKELSPGERHDACPKWFLDEISTVVPIGTISELDFAHLVAVSCITHIPPVPISSRSSYDRGDEPFDPREWRLSSIILRKFSSQGLMSSMSSDQIESGPIGSELKRCWEQSDMKKASLTSAGSLIGMYVRDTISEKNRCIS